MTQSAAVAITREEAQTRRRPMPGASPLTIESRTKERAAAGTMNCTATYNGLRPMSTCAALREQGAGQRCREIPC
jgi:hypothetical protein